MFMYDMYEDMLVIDPKTYISSFKLSTIFFKHSSTFKALHYNVLDA